MWQALQTVVLPSPRTLKMLPYYNCWGVLKILRKRCHTVILSVLACEGIASVTIEAKQH